jgi:uncharacterized protein (TIGR02757 family)
LTADPGTFHVRSGNLRQWLEAHADRHNCAAFIGDDPISVPHRFDRLQDIEIAGLFTAIMAWGQRPTIIRKANALMDLMDGSPYAFVRGHRPRDLKRFEGFCHRTLQPDDVLYLIHVLRDFYRRHDSLEEAFLTGIRPEDPTTEGGLNAFYRMIFDRPDVMERTRKHIPAPLRMSSCKRINMYLRWMVRRDDRGVDFGRWRNIRMDQLVVPLDVHVSRVARELGLLERKQDDWRAAVELTDALKRYDPADPVRFDFALFGAGVSRSLR